MPRVLIVPRTIACVVASLLLCAPPEARGAAEGDVRLEVRLGVDESGRATGEWLSIVRRLWPDRHAHAGEAVRPFTAEESEWIALIRSRAPRWAAEAPALAAPWDPAPPPPDVGILLGNRGASDGFTPDGSTIAFDLSVLHSAYGSATAPENADRIDRLFRHEFTHLLQKSWLRLHPYPTITPLRSALLAIWLEGLGTWHSMSSPWRARGGVPSERAARALAQLEPKFTARIAAIGCSGREAARRLESDLNEGAFDRKWGSLPAALWLEQEMSASPGAYRDLVLAGPDGIALLAKGHLPAPLAAVFEESLHQAEICGEGAGSGDLPSE